MPLDSNLVQEFVVAAHGDLARVSELLDSTPGLVNATWDWGDGDFETALGGAAHMGRKEIATYLLDQGARLDLFCAAMLGKTEIVRAAMEDDPSAIHTLGPHGITLIQHAIVSGQDHIAEMIRAAPSYGPEGTTS
ncbi:MAG: ankyrin repeat domain-containing protein [Actinomycetota bacterium]